MFGVNQVEMKVEMKMKNVMETSIWGLYGDTGRENGNYYLMQLWEL